MHKVWAFMHLSGGHFLLPSGANFDSALLRPQYIFIFLFDHTVGYVLIYPLPSPFALVSTYMASAWKYSQAHRLSSELTCSVSVCLQALLTLLCMTDNSQLSMCRGVEKCLCVSGSLHLCVFSFHDAWIASQRKCKMIWLGGLPHVLLPPTFSLKEEILCAIPFLWMTWE